MAARTRKPENRATGPAPSSRPPKDGPPPLPWFRTYCSFVSDPRITILSFEDQRHFIGILCLKGSGLLDQKMPTTDARDRLIAHALGVPHETAATLRGRLVDAGLILPSWQPRNWSERQFPSDSSTQRWRDWRERKRANARQRLTNVGQRSANGTDVDLDVDLERSKETTE